jgi:hypothetical protein
VNQQVVKDIKTNLFFEYWFQLPSSIFVSSQYSLLRRTNPESTAFHFACEKLANLLLHWRPVVPGKGHFWRLWFRGKAFSDPRNTFFLFWSPLSHFYWLVLSSGSQPGYSEVVEHKKRSKMLLLWHFKYENSAK